MCGSRGDVRSFILARQFACTLARSHTTNKHAKHDCCKSIGQRARALANLSDVRLAARIAIDLRELCSVEDARRWTHPMRNELCALQNTNRFTYTVYRMRHPCASFAGIRRASAVRLQHTIAITQSYTRVTTYHAHK